MKRDTLLVAFLTILFTILFYRQQVGLNLFMFETILLGIVFLNGRIRITTASGWILIIGVAVTLVFTVLHASAFVVTMNLIAMFLLAGWLLHPEGRSLLSIAALSFENIPRAPANALLKIIPAGKNRHRTVHLLLMGTYFIIPLFLVLFFLMLYQQSNPIFNEGIMKITDLLDHWITDLLRHINLTLTGVFLLGLLVAVYFIFRNATGQIAAWDRGASEFLERKKRTGGRKNFRSTGLKSEYRAALFLLITLNLLIALQNVLDIRWIWFGFEWNGQYLRQFVHEGTYLLIISILTSIVIILWYFRGNLNHYPHNRLLKQLSYAWLVQNMILALSVGFRVYWYIFYFALAYKRIGVILFLIITFIGLITVLLKVSQKRSFFYLLRTNALSVFIVLTVASCVNWDGVIAKYNFSHYSTSFVHLDWLCNLSDKTLTTLDRSPEFLATVKQCQDKRFAFEMKYMEPEMYHRIISTRKKIFLKEFSERSFLSWNLADANAARILRPGQ